MIKKLYFLLILIIIPMVVCSQNNAIASFDLPLNNSFKFNKYLINPTFSFVREDYSAINFYNRRQWSQFENPPQVYFINYTGKVGENSSSSIGLYQQNYGVLTNFGAQINYAHNILLSNDTNFTFGFNLSYYNSGFNVGKIVTNSPEPLLQSADSNSLIAFKPGLNFGTGFFDIGITINNLFLYNLKTSQMVANDQGKSYSGHVMYTGYLSDAQGLFEKAKFSTLIQAEKKIATTAFSGNVILDAPNGGWIQAGYNTIYGISGGLGILVTKHIAIGYNYEKGMGEISKLGSNHEITFAYIFRNYNDEDYEPLLFRAKPQPQVQLPKIDIAEKKQKEIEINATRQRLVAEAAEKIKIAQDAKIEKIKQATETAKNAQINNDRLALEALNLKKASDAKSVADAKIQAETSRIALDNANAEKIRKSKIVEKALSDKQTKDIADAAKLQIINTAKATDDARQKADAAKLITINNAKAVADAKLKADAAALKAIANNKATADKEAKAVADAAKLRAIADAKTIADAKLQADVAKLKALADAKANTDAKLKADTEKLKAIADEKAAAAAEKAIADKEAKAIADAAKLKALADAKAAADAKLKADTEKLKEIAAEKAIADKEAKAIADAAKLKALADAKAAADAKLKDDAAKLKAIADEKAATAAEKAAADKEAKAIADAAKLKAIADAKAAADAKLKDDTEKLKAIADEKAAIAAEKATADKEAKAIADAAKLKALGDAKAAADAKLKDDTEKLKAIADEKAAAAAEKATADKEAKAIADATKLKAIADAKAAADAKLKADTEKLKALADEKASAAAEKATADKEAKAIADATKLKAIADAKAAADAKLKVEADKILANREAKLAIEAAKLKTLTDAKATADAKLKTEADKILADKEAKLAAETARLQAIADAKAIANAKLLSEQQEKNKTAADAKAKLDKIESIKSGDVVGKELDKFKTEIDFKSNESNKLLNKFDSLVKIRNSDLQDFKNESLLNSDGTKKVQKKFVSATESNKIVEKLKNDIQQNKVVFDNLINEYENKNNDRIKSLKTKGISDADSKTLNDSYLASLNSLKTKREGFNEKERQLSAEIESIKVAKDLEIRNRIKRAQFDNENEQIKKNQAAIDLLNKNTVKDVTTSIQAVSTSSQPDAANSELTIIRNISGINSGFYLVLDTFSTTTARDSFVSNAISAGAKNVRSFFNFSNNLHYVYIDDFKDIESALAAQKARGTRSYNTKMFTVKVVN